MRVEDFMYRDEVYRESIIKKIELKSGMSQSDILELGLIEEYVETYLRYPYNSYCIDLEVKIYQEGLLRKDGILEIPNTLSLGFLEFHISEMDEIDLELVCRYQVLSEDFIDRYRNILPWSVVCQYQKLSENFIIDHLGYTPSSVVAEFQALSEKYIWDNLGKYDPTYICSYQVLSESFIDRYVPLCISIGYDSQKLWKDIAMCQTLSESFIESHSDILDWKIISSCQDLSEEFIWRNFAKIDIDNILISQSLSEEFLRRFIGLTTKKMNLICLNQVLSLGMVDKYYPYIDWSCLSNNRYLTSEIIEKYSYMLSPMALQSNPSSACDKFRRNTGWK